MCVCSRFDDFDDAIDEAIEEDIRDLCGGESMMWSLNEADFMLLIMNSALEIAISTYTDFILESYYSQLVCSPVYVNMRKNMKKH